MSAQSSPPPVLVVGRGYLGTLLAEHLRSKYELEHLGSELISTPVRSYAAIVWATGPGSSSAPEDECTLWRARVEKFVQLPFCEPAPHVVLISSGGTLYGECEGARSAKESDPIAPNSPYSHFQAWSEETFAKAYLASHTVLRVTNPYGPARLRRNASGFISKVLRGVVLDEPLQILGDGTAERDYVYEKDVCTVVQAAIAERVRGIINVGLGRSYSQSAIIGAVEELTTKTLSNVLLLPSRPSDLRRSAVDVSLLRRTLKDMHQTPLKEGLQETLLSMGYQSR